MARTTVSFLCLVLALTGLCWGANASTRCDCLPQPLHGQVTHHADYVQFGCDVGFTLNGTKSCQGASGIWEPKCSVANCGDLEEVGNGTTQYSSSRAEGGVQVTAQHNCAPGFCLEFGTAEQTCLSSGSWSGSLPTCIPPRTIMESVDTTTTVSMPTQRRRTTRCGFLGFGRCNKYYTSVTYKLQTVTTIVARVAECGQLKA